MKFEVDDRPCGLQRPEENTRSIAAAGSGEWPARVPAAAGDDRATSSSTAV
jgi:hypothetical protein